METATADDELQLERYRTELTGYCYRMTGSAFEAEDAVQETMIRAWRALDRFEGRSSLRSWLYRIATNVCLDALQGRDRRARPMDLTEPAVRPSAVGPALTETTWVEPMPDNRVLTEAADPAERVAQRDSVRLAFIAAIQQLAPRQRAVLILREVLAWKAAEVAELLDTSVASVNSALQRARATLANAGFGAAHADPDAGDNSLASVLGSTNDGGNEGDGETTGAGSTPAMDQTEQDLLARYVEAFEKYDLDALTALLHEDATLSMPPYDLWLQTPDEIRAWLLGPGHGCRGSRILGAGTANGAPAFGQYRPDPAGGHAPWALQVVEISGGRISALNSFLDTARWFPLFGLPQHLPG